MVLNEAGRFVERWWRKIPQKFVGVELDYSVIMPNHFHGIIANVGADQRVCPKTGAGEHTGSPLHRVIQWFKTMTTNEYIKGVKEKGWKPYKKRFWQRSYYEHIIRNERELLRIREYILNNPPKWCLDRENPESRKYLQDHDVYWRDVYDL
jgi:putative transposase